MRDPWTVTSEFIEKCRAETSPEVYYMIKTITAPCFLAPFQIDLRGRIGDKVVTGE